MKPDFLNAGPADGPDAAEAMGGPADGAQGPVTGSAASPTTSEQCVPIDALSMPDEQEQMANPEPGDVVSYQVEGKVSRVEGGQAYVTPTSINGKPVDDAKEAEPAGPEEQDANDFADLQGAAEKQGTL